MGLRGARTTALWISAALVQSGCGDRSPSQPTVPLEGRKEAPAPASGAATAPKQPVDLPRARKEISGLLGPAELARIQARGDEAVLQLGQRIVERRERLASHRLPGRDLENLLRFQIERELSNASRPKRRR
jgi:hypothetical protein